jgi:hypothetical protein
LRVALVAVVLYFAVIVLTPLSDRLALFPTTDRIDAGAAIRKPIPFEGGELADSSMWEGPLRPDSPPLSRQFRDHLLHPADHQRETILTVRSRKARAPVLPTKPMKFPVVG